MPPVDNNDNAKYSLPTPVMNGGVASGNGQNTTEAPAKPKLKKVWPKTAPGPDKSGPNESNNVASSTSVNDNPQIADDNDLIEKEWVAKAKKIIEDNKEDPYKQSQAMTLFKADYMKKRYNKDLKVSE